MAKKKARPGRNSFDPKIVEGYVSRIENLQQDIEQLREACAEQCKEIREDITSVYTEAKDEDGIATKPLKAAIRARMFERRAAAEREALGDTEHIDTYDQIRHALGDLAGTPLGEAALSEAIH